MSASLQDHLATLNHRFGAVEGVEFFIEDELIGIHVHNHAGSARLLLQGAQLLEFTPVGKPRLIWCSQAVEYKQGKPLRGGVPICWPWFGALSNNVASVVQQYSKTKFSGEPSEKAVQAPQHGFARIQDWQLEDLRPLANGNTNIELSLTDNAISHQYFEQSFRLTIAFTVGSSLDIALKVHNTDSKTLNFTGALHSYFAIYDINKTRIYGLDNLPYIDSTRDAVQCMQSGAINIHEETDRIYFLESTSDMDLNKACQEQIIKCTDRKIKIQARGSRSTVVWNPWIEKARALSQFDDDEYLEMVCVETANAYNDYINLAPGKVHELGVNIAYE